jgi:hypothetical protein
LLGLGTRYELAETVEINRADGSVEKVFQRVAACLADRRWDDAVEMLVGVAESAGHKLLPVSDRRYMGVRDYCNLQFSLLPPEALAIYRARVDSQARKWYEEAIATRNPRLLEDIVDRMFASSWGDRALAGLGEMALEGGDAAAARAWWEKIIPARAPPGVPCTWLGFPDTKLDLAGIRARLVLASILEGSFTRAREELRLLAQLHPQARGWFGGRDVEYVEVLEKLLEDSRGWPAPREGPDWPTFAGSAVRNRISPERLDVGPVAWRLRLPSTAPPRRPEQPAPWPSAARVAEQASQPLSYHPVVVGQMVLVATATQILGVNLATGKPLWGLAGPVIYRDQAEDASPPLSVPAEALGVPRFTLSAHQGRLYARLGSPVTGAAHDAPDPAAASCLVCLDLEAEGRLLWRATPGDKQWAFEGSPLVEGPCVYVAMRRSDLQPQLHVACLDADTGRLRWRQWVCAAESPARGTVPEITHNLLSLCGDWLFVNTNLGAVAALSARDGRIRWLYLYPRVRQGDLARPEPFTCRDLNPCLVDRGRVLAAPSDSRRILALDAATGQLLWQSGPEVEDAVHLLGVAGDWLLAAGRRLYWISLKEEDAGKVKQVWPDGPERLGYGRGALSADGVWWPNRDRILLFDALGGAQKKEIRLAPRGVGGGNLVIAPGHLLIAGPDELVALGENGATGRRGGGDGQTRRQTDGETNRTGLYHVLRASLSSRHPRNLNPEP